METAVGGVNMDNQSVVAMRYMSMINGELVAALEECTQLAAMPVSNQHAHPISDAEFRARLLAIGKSARNAIRRAAA